MNTTIFYRKTLLKWCSTLTKISKSHPRYKSLMEREKLVEGFEKGLVAIQGLIAHGRGEAFDYIIGEKTIPPAEEAIKAAVALILTAKHPVISVNGNTAALVPDEIIELSKKTRSIVEVNLFYRTEERVRKIVEHLKEHGAEIVLGEETIDGVPGLESERRKVSPEGIYKADVVLVMLEDGDRTEFLKKHGKKVIAIDLNPFSRTARMADITIVDNVTRALPRMIDIAEKLRTQSTNELKKILDEYNNQRILSETVSYINDRLLEISRRPENIE